jgi:calcium-dependent protein kinase
VNTDEKAKLLQTFKALDLNGDGTLTREELVQGYKKILNVSDPEEEVEKNKKMVDNNKSGTIDYTGTKFANNTKKQKIAERVCDGFY